MVQVAPVLTGAQLLERLGDGAGAYLLDSAGDHPLARFVLAGVAPEATVTVQPASAGGPVDAWGSLGEVWGNPEPGPAPRWPVARSVGYLAYEFGARCERFPASARGADKAPEAMFHRYGAGYVHDLTEGRAWVWGESEGAARDLLTRLAGAAQPPAPARLGPVEEPGQDRAAYLSSVSRVLEYIAAGDIYQANISRRMRAPLCGSPLALYLALRQTSPAPFGAFLDLGELQLLSFSPERFLHLDSETGLVETRPIKGTRPRDVNPGRDQALGRELVASAKDQAEHVMIVDLERNDLGRVCRTGSVRVARLATLESFSHVHHLVSVIEGRLRPAVGLEQVLRATFPGGSITGAPKVRAMEIIAEIEGVPRGPSFGAFGYVDHFGRVDLALAIRTAVVRGDHVDYAAGGGIVADSSPEAEYEEASLKASGFLAASAAVRSPGD